jgi:hypothetical protein
MRWWPISLVAVATASADPAPGSDSKHARGDATIDCAVVLPKALVTKLGFERQVREHSSLTGVGDSDHPFVHTVKCFESGKAGNVDVHYTCGAQITDKEREHDIARSNELHHDAGIADDDFTPADGLGQRAWITRKTTAAQWVSAARDCDVWVDFSDWPVEAARRLDFLHAVEDALVRARPAKR